MKSRALTPLVIGFVAAVAAGLAMRFLGPPWVNAMARVVTGYDVGVLAMLLWHWAIVWRTDASRTKEWAARQDPGRDALFVVILFAVAFGFAAAFSILGRSPQDRTQHAVLLFTVGFAAVVLGWLLIHTVFSFRYAHLYYRDAGRDTRGNIVLKFPGGAEPNYMDLSYFSFVIGMTFQVSDVQVISAGVRRLVLAHGLISFAYNTAILALVVNVVSGLLH